MQEQKLFSIGDVARMFHLSVSSLRHYETLGLLQPERIDPVSNYRYYSVRQFEVLNTIRYLRALDMPLREIADFLQNRDIDRIEQKLRQQKQVVTAKIHNLQRISRKIDNRLQQLTGARSTVYDTVTLQTAKACRIIWMETSLKIQDFYDMEAPIRRWNRHWPRRWSFWARSASAFCRRIWQRDGLTVTTAFSSCWTMRTM